MITRIKNIVSTPKEEFELAAAQEAPAMGKSFNSVAPLFAIPALCSFIGWGLVGYSVFFVKFTSMSYALKVALVVLGACTAAFFAATYIIDALAPTFKSEKNLKRSAQLVAYAMAGVCLCGVFCLFPNMAGLALIGGAVYGGYLMYVGLPKLMKTPEDQTLIYMFASIGSLIITFSVIYFTFSRLLLQISSSDLRFGL